jgi:hypothetical protein
MDARTPKTQAAHTRADIKDALKHIRRITAQNIPTEGYWGKDRLEVRSYFSEDFKEYFRKWETEIRAFLQSVKEAGEPVVYVDVCGRTLGESFGADTHFSFSLQPPDYHVFRDKKFDYGRFYGDLFYGKDYYEFLRLIRTGGHQPSLVIFRPVAGLQDYMIWEGYEKAPRLTYDVTYQRFARNLQKTMEIVRPGGYILLEQAFQLTNLGDWLQHKPVNEYKTTQWVQLQCKKMKCTMRTIHTIYGTFWLLKKRKKRAVPK